MYIIIAGCGRVGAQLAGFLSYEGHDVVVIDSDGSSFRRLGGNFNGIIIEGIAFDEAILSEAGIENADIFAAVTNFDSTNLMAAEIASNIYDVDRVITRLYNPEKELTFYKMGIEYVCGTTLMADFIREKLFLDEEITVQHERPDVGIQLVEFAVTSDAQGKSAGTLDYGVSSRLITLMRDNKLIKWDQNTAMLPGDRVILAMRKEGWNVIRDCFWKEGPESAGCPATMIPVSWSDSSVDQRQPDEKNAIVAGCSQVGAYLAYLMSMEGYRVTVIDKDPKLFKRLPANYSGDFVEGTVYDEETLLKAGIEQADAYTAVTKFDNTNLMAVEVARHVFSVPHVMARLFNPDKESTYQALNIRYVCGTRMLSQALLERMLKPLIRTQTSCLNNMFDLVEFQCPPVWNGKTMKHAKDKTRISFAYVVRRSTGYLPEDNFVLHQGDFIYALVDSKSLNKLEKQLEKAVKG